MGSVSGPSFGNLQVDDNGRARLSSRILGIDPAELIKSLVEVRRIPITKKEVEISDNALKANAYKELETIMRSFNKAARNLRQPNFLQAGTDVFKQKTVSAQSSSATPATSLVNIFAEASANPQTFTLEVNRLARTDRINNSITFTSATNTPLTSNGTITINGEAIALNATDSLQNIANKINASTNDTKVRAELVTIGTNQVRLNLVSTVTGKAITLADSAGALADLGLAASGQTDSSLSAEIVYNGLTLERSTNSITNLVGGTTIDLLSAQIGTEITVTIGKDSSGIKSAVVDFVDAYNLFREFLAEQRTVDSEGNLGRNAILFGDSVMNNINTQLQTMLGAGVAGIDFSTGVPNNLRSIGITFDTNTNLLTINDAVLDNIILNNPEQVAAIFGKQSTSTNAAFRVLQQPKNLSADFFTTTTITNSNGTFIVDMAKDINVSVLETDADGRVLQAEIVFDSNTYTATVQNGVITAPAGSPLEGFLIDYNGGVVNAGDPPVTTVINASQGIADKLANYFDSLLDFGGVFEIAQKDLAEKEVRIQKQIDTLEFQLLQYRDRLIQQFLATEQRVSQLQTTQNFLKSFIDAQTKR